MLNFISYRYDEVASDGGSSDEKQASENQSKIIRDKMNDRHLQTRKVPIICFLYGGGPNSIGTMMEHIQNEDPIVICTGTGRAADLVSDWYELFVEIKHVRIREGQGKGKMPKENIILFLIEKQDTLARAWLLAGGMKLPQTDKDQNLMRTQVNNFHMQLDTIVQYSQLRFFDPQAGSVQRAGGIDDSSDTSLLNLAMDSIFQSPGIEDHGKLLLAIKYDFCSTVSRIMSKKGLQMLTDQSAGGELSFDSRPLVYAAFMDQADVFAELRDLGFEQEQIDSLIFLEMHQLGQVHAIEKDTVTPLSSWLFEQRRKIRNGQKSEDDKERWDEMSSRDQLKLAEEQWWLLTRAERQKVKTQFVQRVHWGRLPFVRGWKYRAVLRVGSERSSIYVPSSFQVVSTHVNDEGLVALTFRQVNGEIQRYFDGVVVTVAEAKRIVLQSINLGQKRLGGQQYQDDVSFVTDASTWIVLDIPKVDKDKNVGNAHQQLLLQQIVRDDVVSALPLDDFGRMCRRPNGSLDALKENDPLWVQVRCFWLLYW